MNKKIIIAILLMLSAPLFANENSYEIQPRFWNIGNCAYHITIDFSKNESGIFTNYEGEIRYSSNGLWDLNLTAYTDSFYPFSYLHPTEERYPREEIIYLDPVLEDTNVAKERLTGPDYLNVQRYKEIRINLHGLEMFPKDKDYFAYEADGSFTLKGITQAKQFTVLFMGRPTWSPDHSLDTFRMCINVDFDNRDFKIFPQDDEYLKMVSNKQDGIDGNMQFCVQPIQWSN